MHRSLAATLFPEYRRQVLGLLLLRPDEALHGREVARRVRLPAGSVARELARLTEVGLLTRHRQGNQQVYQANVASPVYAELASILRKTSGLADVLVKALTPVADRIDLAFVFGSVAQGRESVGSDVDVMVVGDVGLREIVELLHPAEAALGREINPQALLAGEFIAQSDSAFMRDVIAKPKLFLIGTADDLEELAGPQS